MKQGLVLALALVLPAAVAAQEAGPTFESPLTVAENLRQQRALPDPADEVWWAETGEADASTYAERYGIPLTSGGMLARPRDTARLGLLDF